VRIYDDPELEKLEEQETRLGKSIFIYYFLSFCLTNTNTNTNTKT